MNYVAKDKHYLIHGIHADKDNKDVVVFAESEGITFKDINGKEYLDLISGGFNMTLGHGRKEIADAVYKQLTRMDYHIITPGVSNTSTIDLAEKIVSLTKRFFPKMKSVFFASGGAEANEAAIHMVYKYWENKGKSHRTRIISFDKAYHGSSFIAASADAMYKDYGWDRLGTSPNMFPKIPFPNGVFFDNKNIEVGENVGKAAARILEETIKSEGTDSVAAFIFEPIQGDGGILIPHEQFFTLAREICDKYGILMIADEVMTFGKTGRYFAMDHWKVHPDIITLAKGISNGSLPLGAVVVSENIHQVVMNADTPFKHNYTYSGHPACCAASFATLEIMEKENINEKVAEVGQKILQTLTDRLSLLPIVKEVRGIGLMNGIQLTEDKAAEVVKMLRQEEQMIAHANKVGNVVQIVPSVVITEQELERVVSSLERVLIKFGGNRR